MAVINLDYHDLIYLLGKEIPLDEILARVPLMGSDIDSVEGDDINIEFFPNRPDLYSVEGIARALRGFFELEPGLAKYEVQKSGIVLEVDPSVTEVRPFIVSALVKDVVIDDTLIKSLMEIQEKLHLTLGRKRKKLAIGVHDYRNIEPPFVYKAVKPDEVRFIPLQHYEEMNLQEILERHEKGMDYAWTLEDFDRYPIILDSKGQVLSFPPIINGVVTTVTEATNDVFLDMTGSDFDTLNVALNIVVTMLAERGGKIFSVDVKYPDNTYTLPDLAPTIRKLEPAYANRILGSNFSAEEMVAMLQKMRHGARVDGDFISVEVPAYRNDVIHPIDLVEDIQIAAGYENIQPVLPKVSTIGVERDIESFTGKVRNLMVGHGFFETKGYTLSSEYLQFEKLRKNEPESYTKVLNPITEDMTCLRISAIPTLLDALKANQHRDLPQSIFEVGDVIIGRENRRVLAAMNIHPKASYTEVKSLLQSLMGALAVDFSLTSCNEESYIPGRCADIVVGGKVIGNFGELHPEVIQNFDLEYPVWGLEIFLEKLM